MYQKSKLFKFSTVLTNSTFSTENQTTRTFTQCNLLQYHKGTHVSHTVTQLMLYFHNSFQYIQKSATYAAKSSSFWKLRPRPPDQELCPWTPLGHSPRLHHMHPQYLLFPQTQGVWIKPCGFDFRGKFYGDRPMGNYPSIGGVKCKRCSKTERWWTYQRLRVIPILRFGSLIS